MSHQKKKAAQPAAPVSDALSEERRTQIKTFKEMFPQYKSSTNDDILGVFAEFNDNYESAVYGVMNGLVVNKPAESWTSVDTHSSKKKKTKKNHHHGSRSNSANPRNRYDTDRDGNRRDTRDRGQSANRGGERRRDRNGTPNQTNSSTSSSAGRTNVNASRPSQNTSTPAPAPSQPSTSSAKPVDSTPSKPASSGPAWGPRSNAATAGPPSGTSGAATATRPTTSTTRPPVQQQQKPQQQPAHASVPSQKSSSRPGPSYNAQEAASFANVARTRQPWKPMAGAPKSESAQQSLPPAKAPSPIQPSEAAAVQPVMPSSPVPVPTEIPQALTTSKVEEKPRVGVLLPGNFAGEDMSFQFGNLGLSFNDQDLVSGTGRAKEDLNKPTGSLVSNEASRPSTSATKSSELPNQKPEGEPSDGHAGPQLSGYPPMYPGMEMPDSMRGGMPGIYYGEPPRAEGKYSRGPNAQNYTSGGRGESAAAKFPEGANGPQAQGGYPGYYPPMYGFHNQYPGASYNQFYPFRPSYYQGPNFGAMPYGHEEEYKHRGMNPYNYPSQEAPSSPSQEGKNNTSGQEKSSSEGSFPGDASGYGKSPMDYYSQPDMYGSFTGQYYPPMLGQYHQPQPPQHVPQGQQPSQGQTPSHPY